LTDHFAKLTGVLLAAAAAYLLVCAAAFILQRRLIYFPTPWSEDEARRWNLGHEEVWIRTSDGERLHGWLHREGTAPWTVVIFHGNAGNLSHHQVAMIPFQRLGLQVLLFDYRGFGRSSGRPDERGLLLDGDAAVDFVENQLGVAPARIVYYGQSLGSGVAVLLSAGRPPARLILESAFDSLAAVARHHYFFLPAGALIRDRFDAGAAVGRVSCPVLFLHPGEDEIVPLSRGRALFEKANPPKRFVVIPGGRHNDLPVDAPSIRQECLRAFLGPSP
jgi:fermentation-respiration switch protein FrsA (DUF1100 family)